MSGWGPVEGLVVGLVVVAGVAGVAEAEAARVRAGEKDLAQTHTPAVDFVHFSILLQRMNSAPSVIRSGLLSLCARALLG